MDTDGIDADNGVQIIGQPRMPNGRFQHAWIAVGQDGRLQAFRRISVQFQIKGQKPGAQPIIFDAEARPMA